MYLKKMSENDTLSFIPEPTETTTTTKSRSK